MNATLARLSLLAAWTLTAAAAPVTVYFTGSVSNLIADDSSNTFSANFAVGDPVSGSFSFDTTSAAISTSPDLAIYPASFMVKIGKTSWSGPAEYRIFNDAGAGGDGWSIINEDGTYTGPSLGPLVPRTFFIQFLAMPNSTLPNTNLVANPAALVPLADPNYAPNGLRLDNRDGTFGALYFTLDSVSIPEPGTWTAGAALALAVATQALRRRRASSR